MWVIATVIAVSRSGDIQESQPVALPKITDESTVRTVGIRGELPYKPMLGPRCSCTMR
jgi:hypothetical protein